MAGPGMVTAEIFATATAQDITPSETSGDVGLIAKALKGGRE